MAIKSAVTEVGIFAIGIGVIVSLAAIAATNGIDAGAPPIFGMPRRMGIGLPIAGSALLNIAAGVMLLKLRSQLAVAACMVAAISVAVVYFAIMIGSGVGVSINVMTLLFVAIPVMVLVRGGKALEEIG